MGYKKFLIGWDIHGDNQDTEANRAFFKFAKLYKPDIRVCGGDLWDFRAIRKKASEEEKRDSMLKDFQKGKEWLMEFKPNYFLRGNHDERLWDLAQEDRGVISDFAYQGTQEISNLMRKINCHMFPYDRIKGVLRIGSLKVIHGFVGGVTAARRTAMAYGSILMGHGHGISHCSIESVDNRMGRMCGCLCKLDMPYLRASLGAMTHRHGFAYGVVSDTGKYHVVQAERVGNKWLLPTGFEEL